MRSGMAKFDELPYYHRDGEIVVGATVPGLTTDFEDSDRLAELLSLSLADCLKQAPAEPLEAIPLLVGLSEPGRPGGATDLAGSIINQVETSLKVRFHPTLSRAIPKGHTAGFEGLRVARELFANPSVRACLVAGVDSFVNADSLHWLEKSWRLKTEDNPDGCIPGEAAAAVLARPQSGHLTTVTKIAGLGFAHEKASVNSDEPLLGLGLTEAGRVALQEAGLCMRDIDFRLSDVTGESYGFKEQALTFGRLLQGRVEAMDLWHCADAMGDTGAAAGICQLVVAFYAYTKGYAPGNRALAFSSAVAGDRAAAVLLNQVAKFS
jgi:3-oxoacyl-[acyl-carrier-protein] synthase-1